MFISSEKDANYRAGILEETDGDLKASGSSLQNSLRTIIDTIDRIVEMRDAYTSGHQRRVASLARAIAVELKFDDSLVEQVWMTATVHDAGKMFIPIDLLNRPGMLTSLEWEIIKTHPQSGYDILKEIELPFPVANAILQHHERLDGSGYPGGLKDMEIIPAARIIAVADVVEAMVSYRPYRPALGIESALDEITYYSGVLYDPGAVMACQNLFLEKEYQLEIFHRF